MKNVLIISIDALHPSALKTANIPVLRRLMNRGAYTLDGHSSDPPKTLIAHTAMFTGLGPAQSGKRDNQWKPGEPTVAKPTLFDRAKSRGFKTGFFYSKQKLGYLVSPAVDSHKWAKDSAIDLAGAFFKSPGRHFVFLHVSGLDETGPEFGWLSPEYLEELSFMDEYLAPLIEWVEVQRHFLIIVTSDHAGHGKIHGSRHPEDYRLPFIVSTDHFPVEDFRDRPFSVVDLKKIIEDLCSDTVQ